MKALRPAALGLLFCSLFWGVAAGALAGDSVKRFYGYAYDLESGRYLYTELYERRVVDGKWVSGSTRYLAPDGSEIGSKTLDFSRDPYVPVYRLELKAGYAESIREVGAKIVMTRRTGAGKDEKDESVEREGLIAADAGMPVLLHDKFAELLRGETLNFRLAAPGELSTYKFRARKIGQSTVDGRAAVTIQVDLDSMLKLFAGPLQFTFDADGQDLIEYRGTTNIRDPATGKMYVVRVGYYSMPPKDAPSNLPPLP